MSIEVKEKRIQKTVYFEPEVWAALETHMKRERINNVSIAANDALKFSLFPEYRGDREADMGKLFGQVSYSLAEHRKKTGRDMLILQEMMVSFVKEFFKHTHPIPTANIPAAETQAQVRLDAYMEELVRRLPKSKPMSESEE